MKYSIRLFPAAQDDLDHAAAWYDKQSPGLGDKFLAEAYRYFDLIVDHPLIYAIVFRSARQALIIRYPYAIYFVLEESRIVIYAVFHTARDPAIWQSRVP